MSKRNRKAKRWDAATVASILLTANRLETLVEELRAVAELQHTEVLRAIAVDVMQSGGTLLNLDLLYVSPIEVLADVIVAKMAAKLAADNAPQGERSGTPPDTMN